MLIRIRISMYIVLNVYRVKFTNKLTNIGTIQGGPYEVLQLNIFKNIDDIKKSYSMKLKSFRI